MGGLLQAAQVYGIVGLGGDDQPYNIAIEVTAAREIGDRQADVACPGNLKRRISKIDLDGWREQGDEESMKFVGVNAGPTGIARSAMAAEALEQAARGKAMRWRSRSTVPPGPCWWTRRP